MTSIALKFEYKCNLNIDKNFLKIDLNIELPYINILFHRDFLGIPLVRKVDNVIRLLKEGDKFENDNKVEFPIISFTDGNIDEDISESIKISNNKFHMKDFHISLDIIRDQLIGMFDMMIQQINKCKKSELINYLNEIYEYPPERLQVIKRLDDNLTLITFPKMTLVYYMTDFQILCDYLENDNKEIKKKGVTLKHCKVKFDRNGLYYMLDDSSGYILKTNIEKANLIKELKALMV